MSTSPSPASGSLPPAAYVLLLSVAAALGGFLFGFDTAVINGAVIALQNHFGANAWTIGLAVSLALLGSAAGALAAGPTADKLGRPRCMTVASVLFFISAIGSGLPITIWDFIAWRIIGGVAVGAASVLAPAYIAEVSPARYRGRLGSLQQLAIVVGIFIALLSNFFIARLSGGSAEGEFMLGYEAWRWMFWTEAIPAVAYLLASLAIPESPRFLVARQREGEALEVLRRVEPEDADLRLHEIQKTLAVGHRSEIGDILGRFGFLPIIWVGIMLSAFQQLVGINVIFYYGSTLWRAVGFSEADSLWITVITGLTNIVTTFVAIACIDKIGRRPLLLIGSVGMFVTLGVMSYCFYQAPLDATGQPSLEGPMATVALIAANAYVFAFGMSWGPVVWVLLGEMFNNRIRAMAISVAAMVQWIANFAVSTTFPPMAEHMGLGPSYAVYCVAALLSLGFVMFFVKETKGKTLEQMV